RREALGVRQLAAALFLCANNVPGSLFASPLMHSARQGWRAIPFMKSCARQGRRSAHSANKVPGTLFGSTGVKAG
ncbi:MAG TPA: hypothetical protein PLW35_14770, partial [Verrucomicrobiota bacterium]|nr:hypothetical protein [Verrucomicrobiota bacterium]